MNAPRAEANKSIADVENTAVSLSGILTDFYTFIVVWLLTPVMTFMFNAVLGDMLDSCNVAWYPGIDKSNEVRIGINFKRIIVMPS